MRSEAVGAKAIRFAFVGGLSSVAYAIFTVLSVESLGIAPLPATVLGYLLVIPFNFFLQRRFTFRGAGTIAKELPRFLLVHVLNIIGSASIMYLATKVVHADYRWGVVFTMGLVPVLVYVIMDRWVFETQR